MMGLLIYTILMSVILFPAVFVAIRTDNELKKLFYFLCAGFTALLWFITFALLGGF